MRASSRILWNAIFKWIATIANAGMTLLATKRHVTADISALQAVLTRGTRFTFLVGICACGFLMGCTDSPMTPFNSRLVLSASYYVSPAGSDSNPGTLAQPFATIDHAQHVIRSLKKSGQGLPTGGVTVYLRGGIYDRSTTLSLTSADSGTADKPIVYEAYNGEDVRIVGGEQISTSWFTPVTSTDPVYNRLDPAARGHVVQMDLTAHGITNFGTFQKRAGWTWNAPAPLELFYNGVAMELGRYPNEGFINTNTVPTSTSFTYTDPRGDRWATAEDPQFSGLFGTYWFNAMDSGSVNASTNTITLKDAPPYGVKAAHPFYAFNMLEEIDTPGEWYLNRDTGKLYFWAPSDLSTGEASVSMMASDLLKLTNTSYVTFSGITFEQSRAGLITISGGSHDTIDHAILRNSGTYGIMVSGSNNGIQNSQIYDIGTTAVTLQGGTRATLTAANNFVKNSDIHDWSRWVTTSYVAVRPEGVGQIISHNEIHDGPAMAIWYIGNNHLIEYNDIYNVCKDTQDAGAIYMGRDWSLRGTVIRYNYIHDLKSRFSDNNLFAIYFDDASSQADVYGNLFARIGGYAGFNAGGRDNHWYNNMIIDCYGGHLGDRRGMDIITGVSGDDCNFLQKLDNAAGGDFHTGAWAAAYPELAKIPDNFSQLGELKEPGGTTFTGNWGWNNTNWMKEGSWAGLKGAFQYYASTAGNVANQDPLFVDAAHGNYNLKANSPVYTMIPGWKAIPFDQIGIQGDGVPTLPPPPPTTTNSDQVIVDNTSAGFSTTGAWNASSAADGYNGGSVTAMNIGSTATWQATLAKAGSYAVYAWWSAKLSDGTTYARDAAADYTVTYDGGTASVTVDQNKNSGQWVLLGNYNFAAGAASVQVVRNSASGTSTAADAVEFVLNATTPTNQLPVAGNDTASGNEDSVLQISNVLANDTDADGNALTISAFTQATHGTVALGTNGGFVYTPAANYNGADAFTYTISDGQGGTATATVAVTVKPVNDAPVANGDQAATNEDTVLQIANVLANDTDVDGNALTVASFTQAGHGTVALGQDGGLVYMPAANYNGTDSFTYTISDGQGGTATATVTITVRPVNDAPVAIGDQASTSAGSVLQIANVLANDTDVDGNALTIASFTQATHGAVTLGTNGGFVYTPAALYSGPDSFTYTISDGQGGVATATVAITVLPVNTAPIARSDSGTVNTNCVMRIANVMDNDTDVDGDTLTIASFTQAAHGTVVHGDLGAFVYTPVANYYGPDSFTYAISDGHGGTATTTVAITVKPVNNPPIAGSDSATVNMNSVMHIANVMDNDTDVDGNKLTIVSFTQAAHGTVVHGDLGAFVYTPVTNYYGPDSFTYTISDGQGGTATATVAITVKPLNLAPVAKDDSLTAIAGQPVSIANVLANDTDANGDTLTVTSFTQPTHGRATRAQDGSFTYTASTNYSGSDRFTYTVSDGHGGTATGAVNLLVTANNRTPTTASPVTVIVDNTSPGFTTTGTWQESAAIDEYAGSSVHSNVVGSTAKWTPTLPSAGTYQVWVWYSAKSSATATFDRDSHADYTINYTGGSNTVIVDQDKMSGQWVLVGTYDFAAGTSGNVQLIRNSDDGMATSADAVRFVKVLAPEVIVDNTSAGFSSTGTWNASTAVDSYNGSSVTAMYSGSTATWRPTLTESGSYNVFAWWSDKKADGTTFDRDSAASYTVNHTGGATTVLVDQDVDAGSWVYLGTFTFDAGTAGTVTLTRDQANGTSTVADAVRFVKA